MIRVVGESLETSVNGVAIYLDNWAIGDLAEGDSSRRERFVEALHTGRADLLFSVTNAAELAGPQGKSRADVRAFLDAIGPHWFPVELDTRKVLEREQSGASPGQSCISKEFLVDFMSSQMRDYWPGSGKI